MLKEFKNNPYFRFTFLAIILYVLWYIVYEIWLHPAGIWDRLIISNLITISNFSINFFGYTTLENTVGIPLRVVGVVGTPGVKIGDPCDGFSLFALFFIFIITYPGPWKQKLWYIPMGLLAIHLINAMRITALAILLKEHWQWVEFNHNYTFTIIVYGMVFLLWWYWAKKFASPWLKAKEAHAKEG